MIEWPCYLFQLADSAPSPNCGPRCDIPWEGSAQDAGATPVLLWSTNGRGNILGAFGGNPGPGGDFVCLVWLGLGGFGAGACAMIPVLCGVIPGPSA